MLALRITPDELQGRFASVAMLLSLGSVPFEGLLAGVLLSTGSTATVFVLFGVLLIVAVAAFASPAVRQSSGSPS